MFNITKSADMVADVLLHILDYQNKATLSDFKALYGKQEGEHLWRRYRDCEYNILDLYLRMDSVNRRKLQLHVVAQMLIGGERND